MFPLIWTDIYRHFFCNFDVSQFCGRARHRRHTCVIFLVLRSTDILCNFLPYYVLYRQYLSIVYIVPLSTFNLLSSSPSLTSFRLYFYRHHQRSRYRSSEPALIVCCMLCPTLSVASTIVVNVMECGWSFRAFMLPPKYRTIPRTLSVTSLAFVVVITIGRFSSQYMPLGSYLVHHHDTLGNFPPRCRLRCPLSNLFSIGLVDAVRYKSPLDTVWRIA